jgi:transcriptional regulator GlxA family with amidase domain
MAWLQWPRIGPHLGHVVASGPQAAAIEQAFADLTTNFSAELALRDELASNLLAQIILRAQQINPDSQHRPIEQRVRKAQLYIEEHFAESFSVHDVAGHVGVSPSHLSSLFKQHTGMTLLAWRDEKRMMAAARDLLTTNRAVSEVAAACGFDDGPFFSRCFRKHFGCSPRDYRSRGGKPG